MRAPSRLVPLLLLSSLAACSQFTIRTRHDPGTDFARFHTFAWLPRSEAEPADQRVQDRAVDARLRADVDRELRAKGFVPAADGAAPDVLLNYRISSSPTSGRRSDGSAFGWETGWWTGWAGGDAVYQESYDTGTLFLAVLDPRTKHMIWLGTAEARLLPTISLERRLKRVDDAVAATLADFPPR